MHVIRLRGPWNVVGADGQRNEIQLPCAREKVSAQGGQRVVLERRFRRPTGIDLAESVELAARTAADARIERLLLNGSPLYQRSPASKSGPSKSGPVEACCDARAETRDQLQSVNLLRVELTCGADAQADLLAVQLEIRELATDR